MMCLWPGSGPYDTFGFTYGVLYRPFPAQQLKGETKEFLSGILSVGPGR